MEIQSITPEVSGINAVYGFGSFFRGEAYNDIDVVAVASPLCRNYLSTYFEFRNKIDSVGTQLDVTFDITFLTEREFAERPLLEMDQLVEVFQQKST